jgi:hypothetical protein
LEAVRLLCPTGLRFWKVFHPWDTILSAQTLVHHKMLARLAVFDLPVGGLKSGMLWHGSFWDDDHV